MAVAALLMLAFAWPADEALAACAPGAPVNNATVTCSGTTTNQNSPNGYGTGVETGNTITVGTTNTAATVQGTTNGFSLGDGNTVNVNNGSLVTGVTNGITAGSGTAGTLTVNNTQGAISATQTTATSAAISVSGSEAVNVTNSGTIKSPVAAIQSASSQIILNNQLGGLITATGTGFSAIVAGQFPVLGGSFTGSNAGTITSDGAAITSAGNITITSNSGNISATSTGPTTGIALNANGDVTVNANTGTIQGGFGAILSGGNATVTNSNTITYGSGFAISAVNNATVTNNQGASITGGTNSSGVLATNGTATVTNSGTISSSNLAVSAGNGTAMVTNNATGTISTDAMFGFTIGGLSVNLINSGTVRQTGGGGAAVFGGSTGTITVTNNANGMISASGGGQGISATGGLTVTNNANATIQGTGTGSVGILANSGTQNVMITNGGLISGDGNAINTNTSGTTTIVNNGTISNTTGGGATPGDIRVSTGSITNTGTINGNDFGIFFRDGHTASSVFDSSAISGGSGTAIHFSAGSIGNTLTLAPGFTITGNVIQGSNNILQLGGSSGFGTFDVSTIGPQYQNFTTFNKIDSSTWTLINTGLQNWSLQGGLLNVSGTIGNVTVQGGNLFVSGSVGTGATAVQFLPSAIGSTVTVAPGFTINGIANGDNVGTFQLGGSSGSGSFNVSNIGPGQQYQNFIAFNKVDNSTWTLTGTTGVPWTVEGGTLNVTGTIGNATVDSGAALTGTGTVGSLQVNSGGIFAPGAMGVPGTSMTINGSLAFQSAAIYLVQVNPTNSTSALVVGGNATLNGTVDAVFANGQYMTREYDILHANAVNGTFSALDTLNLPIGVLAALSYTSTDVFLDLTAALPTQGLNTNQFNVANAIDNFFNNGGKLPASFVGILGLTGTNLANALTQLDGEAATGAQTTAFELMNEFLALMTDPLDQGRTGNASLISGFAPEQAADLPPEIALAYASILKAPPKAAAEIDRRWSVWGAGFGGSETIAGNATIGSNRLAASTFGGTAGIDYRLTPNTVVGFALSGAGTNWNLAQGLGSGRSDAFQAGIYGKTTLGAGYITAAFAFANHWMTTSRTVLGDQATASFDAQDFAGRIEAGYRYGLPMAANAVSITPYAALQAQSFHTPAYSETDLSGGGFGLTFAERTASDTRSELGARFEDLTTLNGRPLILRAKAAWAHDWVSDATAAALFQALPGASFIVTGAAQPKDLALVSGGAQYWFTPHWSFLAQFDGEFAQTAQSYAGTGTLRYSW